MNRLRILALFAALVALPAAFAACGSSGGSGDPQTVVEEATFQGIESGKLDLSMSIDIKGEKSGHVDVQASGPFQKDSEAEYPSLDLSASAKGKVGGEPVDFEGAFTLLGNKAYVGYEGTEYEVDSTTFDFVKSTIKQRSGTAKGQSGEATACQEAASGLELSSFLENLKGEGSADVGGTSTTKVSGDLDVSGAIDAFSTLTEDPACSEQLSAAGAVPSGAELDAARGTIEESVKAAHVDLYVGDDHIVRRVVVEEKVEPQQGTGNGAKRVEVDADLSLTGVNEDQTITAPKASKPLGDLFLKLGINPIELLGILEGQGAGGIGGLLEGLNGAGGTQ